MSDLNKFAPMHEEYFDIDGIVDNATAADIGAKLLQIEADIKAANPVIGDIKFSMSPNSLCASWNYLKEVTPESVMSEQAEYEGRVEKRRLALLKKQLAKLSSVEKALGLAPRQLTQEALS